MIEISRDVVKTAMEDAGMDPGTDLREGYSGRRMYGETMFGVIGSDAEFASFLVEYAKAEGLDGDTAQELAQRVRTDAMGRQTVFYFPGVKLVDGD